MAGVRSSETVLSYRLLSKPKATWQVGPELIQKSVCRPWIINGTSFSQTAFERLPIGPADSRGWYGVTHSLARPRRCPWGRPCHTLSANTSVAYGAAAGGSLNAASPLGRLGCPVHGAGAVLVKAASGVRSGLTGSVVGAGRPQPRRRVSRGMAQG